MFDRNKFGSHPNYWIAEKAFRRHTRRRKTPDLWGGPTVRLEEFKDPRHPEVALIPRNIPYHIIDEWEEPIFPIFSFPFSSFDFYVDIDDNPGLFHELVRTMPFSRLGGISQLGYLVPPRPEDWEPGKRIAYVPPVFSHTRWLHSLIVAILMEVVLARNGFNLKSRIPVLLAAGYHDIGMPAGGDPIKSIDPEELDEEKNFSPVLKRSELAKKWKKAYGFNIKAARQWVAGRGKFGSLLDAIDKIAYTTIDCYSVGMDRPGRIRDFCLRNPLVSDVWQDIAFSSNKKSWGFRDPDRLYDLLTLRALEHAEFLLNPDSRKLDLLLVHHIRPLYKQGKITKEQLLSLDNFSLEQTLQQIIPDKINSWLLEPDIMGWKRFETIGEAESFCREIGESRVERIEESRPFNPGLRIPVLLKEKALELREVLPSEKIEALEAIASERTGFYVFHY